MDRRDDEFYVGYLRESPPRIAAHTRVTVGLVLAIGLAVGLLAVSGQGRFDAGTFEYGVERAFEGLVLERPYPMLLVPAAAGSTQVFESHYLVAFGKRGAQSLVAGMDGAAVRVVGSRIHNGSERMVDVRRIEPLDAARAAELRALERVGEQSLGTMTLVGEIVDSKCHLGVMKPGRGKPHEACAIRCLSGGIPPVLRVEGRTGRAVYFLLVAPDGHSVNREVLHLVAEPVEIKGEVARAGDLLVLYADPSTYRRAE